MRIPTTIPAIAPPLRPVLAAVLTMRVAFDPVATAGSKATVVVGETVTVYIVDVVARKGGL